jgi:hypothetical protein
MPGWSEPHADAVRRNKPKFNSGELVWDGIERGPELPGIPEGWCEKTREWYDYWRRSAQATRFDWGDWEYIQTVALLHNSLWDPLQRQLLKATEMKAMATEIRVSMQTYGYTDGDRQRMRMTIKYPTDADVTDLAAVEEETPDNVVGIDYRKRLGG